MRLTEFDQVDNTFAQIYIAPHLDDAALSCGGAILLQRQAGERVLVVTLCTAAPPAEGPFSDLAQEFHGQWSLSPGEVVATRLAEDALSMERLDVDYFWADMLDAIYRYPSAYHSRATLFNTPAGDDPLLPDLREFIGALRDRAPDATIYAPLGVGSHADHLITYQAALGSAGEKLVFYEDFPYAATPGELERRLAFVAERLHGTLVEIETVLAGKVEAIGAYASQMEELFGGYEAMARAVDHYCRGLRPDAQICAERTWRLSR